MMPSHAGALAHTTLMCRHVPSSKKKVSIEDLLVWAYRDQMVHAARLDSLPPELWARLRPQDARSDADSIVRVSSSVNYGFTAAADAYVVDSAVRWLSPIDEVWPESMTPARGFPLPWLHNGRVLVDRSNLVWTFALRGERPDWIEAPSTELRRGNVVYDRARKRPLYCEVFDPLDLPWEVARARFIYWCWWSALEELARTLHDLLQTFSVGEPLPPEKPWASDLTAEKT